MKVFIQGLGTATPVHSVSQEDAATIATDLCCTTAQQKKLLPALYRRTGVRRRHSVIIDEVVSGSPPRQSFFVPARDEIDAGPPTSVRMQRYELEAGRLAVSASRRAFESSDVKPCDVTHLITVSCSGFSAPGFDIALIRDLELPPGVERTHVGFMGCHGALNGLRVAGAFVRANPGAVVLVCAVELCTLHQQYGWDPEQIVANALFADGAAAVLVGANDPGDSRELVGSGSQTLSGSEEMMSWRIADNGFKMTLSPKLPDLIKSTLADWIGKWLSEFELDIEEIGSWAIHPGGPRVLSASGEALGLSEPQLEPCRAVLASHGNMSSPTVLFILQRLVESNAAGPCVMLGFGPGITIEAALLR